MKINYTNINFKAKKMSVKQADYIDNILKKSKDIDIICHETTDRDAANSALAMYDYLKQQGINARIILSQNLESLTLRNKNANIIQAKNLEENSKPDTVLCVDFSAKERVAPNVLEHIKKANNIVGFDHHIDANIIENPNEITPDITPFYVDTTAKSATSVIYRFFEALDENISKETAYDLFFGLISDCNKKGLIHCDGIKGEINETEELIQDKNAYEIYLKLKEKISDEDISDIARKIDIITNLTDDEKEFYKSLYKKIKFSKNQEIAYVMIPPDDTTWKKLGGDNTTTSSILNQFRRDILRKYKNTKIAVAFYEANGTYRASFHSKEKNLEDLYILSKDKIKEKGFTIGGHNNRGGAKILSTEPDICEKWAKEIINCANLI